MQSARPDAIALFAAVVASIACGLIASLLGEGNAALLLGMLAGFTLGFVMPRGAWRWALVLALWVPIVLALRVKLAPSAAFAWCPQTAPVSPFVAAWTLALVPIAAVYAGVIADWFVTQAIRWLGTLGWPAPERTRAILRVGRRMRRCPYRGSDGVVACAAVAAVRGWAKLLLGRVLLCDHQREARQVIGPRRYACDRPRRFLRRDRRHGNTMVGPLHLGQ